MAYIETGVNQPGVVELLFYKGATGKALANLVHTVLRGPSGLKPEERELIAAHVSKLNDCSYCQNAHAAAASLQLGDQGETVNCVLTDPDSAPVSDKLKALLKIAGKVQRSGKEVSQEHVAQAKAQGASDEDVHDTVLIAATFCMFNRYVDGLGTAPATVEQYRELGKRNVKKGYKYPPLFLRRFIVKMMNKQAAGEQS